MTKKQLEKLLPSGAWVEDHYAGTCRTLELCAPEGFQWHGDLGPSIMSDYFPAEKGSKGESYAALANDARNGLMPS